VTFKRHILAVHALNLPNGAQLSVSVARRVAKRYATTATKTVASAWVRLRVASWDRVTVRFVQPGTDVAASAPATIVRTHRSRRYVPLRGRQ
jgi:type IV secretory pathway VirJ component